MCTEARTRVVNLMAESNYRGWIWALALVGFFADQGAKYGIFHWLHQPDKFDPDRVGYTYELIPGSFRLVARFTGSADENPQGVLGYLRTLGGSDLPEVNHGALFGWLSRHQEHANTGFAIISVAAALAIIYWGARRATGKDFLLCVALGLIL